MTDSRPVRFTTRPCAHCQDPTNCAFFGGDYDPAICVRCLRRFAWAFNHVAVVPGEEIVVEEASVTP